MKNYFLIVFVMVGFMIQSCKKPIDPREACIEEWQSNSNAYLPDCGGCNQGYTVINANCYQENEALSVFELGESCLPNIVIWARGSNLWLISNYSDGTPLGNLSFVEKQDGNMYSDSKFYIDSECNGEKFYLLFVFTQEEWLKANSASGEAIGSALWILDTSDDAIPFRETEILVRGVKDGK